MNGTYQVTINKSDPQWQWIATLTGVPSGTAPAGVTAENLSQPPL